MSQNFYSAIVGRQGLFYWYYSVYLCFSEFETNKQIFKSSRIFQAVPLIHSNTFQFSEPHIGSPGALGFIITKFLDFRIQWDDKIPLDTKFTVIQWFIFFCRMWILSERFVLRTYQLVICCTTSLLIKCILLVRDMMYLRIRKK